MMNRAWSRRAVVGAGVGSAVAVLAASAGHTAGRALGWPLGVQLWSVNDLLAADLGGTLRRLHALGYREVELAGLHGHTPAAFAAAAAAAGVRPVGAHYGMADLRADPARCIGEARDVGATWLVAASPQPDRALSPGQDWLVAMRAAMTPDAWARNADALDPLAARARAAGLGLAFHNHPIEFARMADGRRGIDILLARTDPASVKWELDVAWAVAGGDDPVALLRTHRDRIRLLHLKGLHARPMPGTYGTDLSTGVIGQQDVINWPAVLAAARGGVRHLFVEQEPPHVVPVFTALAECRTALERLA